MKKISDGEWEQMLKEGLSNEDLMYLMRLTNKKDEAWEILKKRNLSNEDLIYLIRYTDKKEEAKQILDSRPKKNDRYHQRKISLLSENLEFNRKTKKEK